MFEIGTLLEMAGEPQPALSSINWLIQGELPGGLSFDNENGTVHGTPTQRGEQSFEVTASYEEAQAQQTYTIVVNGAPYEVLQVAGGDEFTCALLVNRTVKCWGSNAQGRLGDGTNTNRTVPVPVAGLTGVAALAGGNSHTCALLTNQTVRCWGSNNSGQLGDGTMQDRWSPVPVDLQGVKAVAAGYETTCALLANNTMACWGRNTEGQLGNNSTQDSSTPVSVAGLTGLRSIGVGYMHSCAVLSDKTVKCWGRNVNGELGNGTTSAGSKTPVVVRLSNNEPLADVHALALRSSHSCSLSTVGRVRCWGFNGNGRIGNGDKANAVTYATQVMEGAAAVVVGGSHTCALRTDGTVSCWGRNDYGQLGFVAAVEYLTPGAGPSNLGGVTDISLGHYHTCAALADGAAKCWGYNNVSQVGDGTQQNQPAPVPVQWD